MGDVLVVEDDRVVLSAVAGECRDVGLEVDEAVDVEEAVIKLYGSSYRLAIVDLMLPKESGFNLLRNAQAMRRVGATVVISGYATVLSALESFRLGAFDFLPKPFDVRELMGVVRRVLRHQDRETGEQEKDLTDEQRYSLGGHSWATLDAEGMATIGAGDCFKDVLGEIDRVDLPSPNDHITQGQLLVRIDAGDEVYRVWSPLSGRIVATNEELEETAELIAESPFDRGWLVRLAPLDLESESRRLAVGRGAPGAVRK